MTNVLGCAFLVDFTFENQGILKCNEEILLFESLLQNPKVYFPTIGIMCRYDVELVTMSKNLWIKVIHWSAATNSKWQSEESVIFLLVYEFRELLLRFNKENRWKWQHCDHRSLFPSPSRITSCLLQRLEGVAQGFRKSFSAWGLNFRQFSSGFNFEIVGHSYKDFINKNKHVQHRCTSALKLWESNQKEMTNMKHMF